MAERLDMLISTSDFELISFYTYGISVLSWLKNENPSQMYNASETIAIIYHCRYAKCLMPRKHSQNSNEKN